MYILAKRRKTRSSRKVKRKTEGKNGVRKRTGLTEKLGVGHLSDWLFDFR